MSVRSKPNREREAPTDTEHDEITLPEGWAWVSLSDVTVPVSNIRPEDEPDREFNYVDISSICNETFRLTDTKSLKGADAPSRARRPVQPNDTLFSNVRTYLRNIALVDDATKADVCSTGFTVLRPDTTIDPRYLFRYALSDAFIDVVSPQQTGTHYPATSDRAVLAQRIPLAPLAEQRRIVGKLELLLGKVSSSQQRLSRVPGLLKRFRQSVLAAACSGKLTADWREENPQPALTVSEPATIGIGIPESWTIATVGEVIDGLKYGTSHKCGYPKTGVPVLRIPNIAAGVIDHSDMKYAELESAESEQLRLRTGDILLIRSNGSVSLVGKTALVRETEQNFAYAGYLIRLRPDRAKVTPEFLNAVLGSYDVRLQIEIPARSTSGVNNINSEEVRSLRIPLPPLSEQQEIVRRVERLFALADQIEARLRQAQAHVDRLTQSLLAKAFRGELVPNEATLARRQSRPYEPATELLARIQGEPQSKTEQSPKNRKRHSVQK